MRRTHLATLVALAAVAVPVGALASSASATVTPAWTKYFLAGGTTSVSGLKVSGFDGKRVYVSVKTDAPGATVAVGTTGNTDPPYGYTYANTYRGSSVQFIGDQDQVNAALASLSVTLPADTRKASLITTAFENRADLAYNPANQHFYKYVAIGPCAVNTSNGCTSDEQTARSPNTAKANAEASTEMGLKGYLASITSADENDFISSKIEGATAVVVGGRDSDAEGTWTWVGGPDNGTQFWSGNCVAEGGKALGYANWSTGEPNNYISSTNKCGGTAYQPLAAEGEDCMVTNWTDNSPAEKVGYWNDVPCGNNAYTAWLTRGYVAEYGNQSVGGSFSNVDIVSSVLNVPVPATQPTWLDTLFQTLSGPKKTAVKLTKAQQRAQAKAAKKKAKQTRMAYDLVFKNGGRFSFYLTNPQNKVIPISEGSSIAGRKLTKPMSVPVIRDIKAGATVKVTLIGATKKMAKGALLNVILQEKLPDGTFKLYRQDAPDPPLVKVD